MKLTIMSILGCVLLLFGAVSMAYPINLKVTNNAGKGITAAVVWNICDGGTSPGVVANSESITCTSPELGGKGEVNYAGEVGLHDAETKLIGTCKIRLKLGTQDGKAHLSELTNDAGLQGSGYLCVYTGYDKQDKSTGKLVIKRIF